MADLLDDGQRRQWLSGDELDLALSLPGVGRLRLNLFRQRNGLGASARLIPARVPSLDELDLNDVYQVVAQCRDGLVLVGGPTGSGKSSTLAALLDQINRERALQVITLEDPIEFIHSGQGCLVNQREIGVHSRDFAQGLRSALRQDPDVIMVGELRDLESIRLALRAAETGHLVLATLHTRGASQAIERLVDTFPAQEKDPVRTQLAGSLRAVLAQKLRPDLQGGRVALYELLVNTPAAANLIREGKTWQLPGIVQTGQQAGMQNFEQSLAERRAQGRL